MPTLTYRDAGVDIDAGDELIDRIKPLAAATHIPESIGAIGGFAALCGLPQGMRDPVLVSGTDGVGTKLKVAFASNRHHTIGIDLVAMCANDIVTVGARPLFFLDYFATGALDVEQATEVIAGIAEGCKRAGCALLGGETAELPGFYHRGEYDLAGFAVGVVERDAVLNGARVQSGDVVIGLESDGLHSNGYSLARAALLDAAGISLDARVPELGETLADALLRPTRMYVKPALAAIEVGGVHALCHITGGGIPGNLPRVLPDGLGVEIDSAAWTCPAVFKLIQQAGNVAVVEMRRTFNLGIGFVAVVATERVDDVMQAFAAAGERPRRIGVVLPMPDAVDDARVRYV